MDATDRLFLMVVLVSLASSVLVLSLYVQWKRHKNPMPSSEKADLVFNLMRTSGLIVCTDKEVNGKSVATIESVCDVKVLVEQVENGNLRLIDLENWKRRSDGTVVAHTEDA
jgi:hypothetical protein